MQYADYALWQQQLLGDDQDPETLAAAQLGFWRQALADLPEELVLPTDRPRPQKATYHGGRVGFAVPTEVYQGLLRLARDTGTTLFMVAQTALAALYTRLVPAPTSRWAPWWPDAATRPSTTWSDSSSTPSYCAPTPPATHPPARAGPGP